MKIKTQVESTQEGTILQVINTEMCAVTSNLEDRNPPLVFRHREETMADGRTNFHIISDTDSRHDGLFLCFFFQMEEMVGIPQ